MKNLSEFLNESLVNESTNIPKPIHLLKNDETYCSKIFFKACMDSLAKEWPSAVQDNHEDEYVFVTDDNDIYNMLFDKYCTNKIEGISTKGSRNNYFGWKKYKADKYPPIYVMFRGISDDFKGTKTKSYQNRVILFDRHLLDFT